MKRALLFNMTAAVICAGMLAGCGSSADTQSTAGDDGGIEIETIPASSASETTEATKLPETPETTEASETTPDHAGWNKALEDNIKNDKDKDTYDWYALIYIDDDDIPEVVKQSKYAGDGDKVATYDKDSGKVTDNQLRRFGLYYAERENILVNSDGCMDSYYDTVYAIKNGVLVETAGGEYGAFDNKTDTDGNLVYEYYWNDGNEISKDEYYKEYAAATDNKTVDLIYSKQQMSYDEIIAQLEAAE